VLRAALVALVVAGCGARGPAAAIFMCHGDGDCAPGEHCCALASGTTYSACRSGC